MKVIVLIKANEDSEKGVMPSEQLFIEMAKFNEELVNAGVMLAGEGLHPSAKGKRIRFTGPIERTVIDGPFPETKELLAGYWIWKVGSMEEAVEWARRIPNPDAKEGEVSEIEIRPIFEAEDFGDALPAEVRGKGEQMRAKLEGKG